MNLVIEVKPSADESSQDVRRSSYQSVLCQGISCSRRDSLSYSEASSSIAIEICLDSGSDDIKKIQDANRDLKDQLSNRMAAFAYFVKDLSSNGSESSSSSSSSSDEIIGQPEGARNEMKLPEMKTESTGIDETIKQLVELTRTLKDRKLILECSQIVVEDLENENGILASKYQSMYQRLHIQSDAVHSNCNCLIF